MLLYLIHKNNVNLIEFSWRLSFSLRLPYILFCFVSRNLFLSERKDGLGVTLGYFFTKHFENVFA